MHEAMSESAMSENTKSFLEGLEPAGDVLHDTWCDRMTEAMMQMNARYGGPESYLRARFQGRADYVGWLEYLVHLIPTDCNHFEFDAETGGVSMDGLGQAG